jgi:hypothetical protein
MASLGAKERAQLPDSAFAYIDSRGRRRLPINDAAHVRDALIEIHHRIVRAIVLILDAASRRSWRGS